MIIKVKTREECLEAGFRQAIGLYGLDIAHKMQDKEDELLDHLPNSIFNSEQIVNHIESDITGKCYHVNEGWVVSDIFVEYEIGEV